MFKKNLISELKQEHILLLDMLNKVKDLKVSSAQGRSLLQQSKETLLKHLEKEDKELYPPLLKIAESDISLKQILEEFASDMDTISQSALDFFEKYSNAAMSANFIVDFYKLVNILKKRINREENILYELYLKFSKK